MVNGAVCTIYFMVKYGAVCTRSMMAACGVIAPRPNSIYSMEKKKIKDNKIDSPQMQMQRQRELWARQLNAADSIFVNLPDIVAEMDN